MAEQHPRSRGLSIWPFILIGAGVVWLMAEAGLISGANLSVLARLWPVILIAIGIELLVGRSSQALSTLIGVFTVVLLIGLMLVGPSLGLATSAETKQDSFSAPLEGASGARIQIEATVGVVNVEPLTDSNALFQADIQYLGDVDFNTSDSGGQRVVELTNDYDGGMQWFNFLSFIGNDDLDWNIGLSDAVPLDLTVNTGTGAANLDLTPLQISALNVSTGTGSVDISLPSLEASYNALVSTGTGGVDISIPEDGAVNLRVSSGTGGVSIDVSEGAAVRLVGSVGTGGIDVPSWMQRIGGDDENNFLGAEGTWETEGFNNADRQIVINFSGGTGGLDIR